MFDPAGSQDGSHTMGEKSQKKKVEPVTPEELLSLRDALSGKYGAYLRPGEWLTLDAERTKEHAWATITLETSDQTERLELECASVPGDVEDADEWDAATMFDLVIDLLDAQLENWFDDERLPRFHDDWRVYDFEGNQLRFRGLRTRPDLEALADAWLESGGDPTRPEDKN